MLPGIRRASSMIFPPGCGFLGSALPISGMGLSRSRGEGSVHPSLGGFVADSGIVVGGDGGTGACGWIQSAGSSSPRTAQGCCTGIPNWTLKTMTGVNCSCHIRLRSFSPPTEQLHSSFAFDPWRGNSADPSSWDHRPRLRPALHHLIMRSGGDGSSWIGSGSASRALHGSRI